jgi:hypothetical protein
MGAHYMNAFEDAQYRLKIAQGFLAERIIRLIFP